MKLIPLLRTLRSGDARGRLAALRTAPQALTVAVTGAALRTDSLDELREPARVDDLARRRGWDRDLTDAPLRSLATHGRAQGNGARLPDMKLLAEQLPEAGLAPEAPRRSHQGSR